MTEKTIRITSKQMQDVLYKLFLKYKFTKERAKLMANVYTESTLVGVYSHGINRLPLFIEYVENGLVKIDAEAEKVETFGSIERWDGNLGPGIINATKCTNRAIELAKLHGMGMVERADLVTLLIMQLVMMLRFGVIPIVQLLLRTIPILR